MKIELDVDVPEGYEVAETRIGPAAGYLGDSLRAEAVIIIRKKKSKVIVFVPDAQGTHCIDDRTNFAVCDVYGCTRPRYRREEREE